MNRAIAFLVAVLLVFASTGASAHHRTPREFTYTGADLAEVVRQRLIRDGLIAAQEAVLNVYRCELGRDVQTVPGGCPAPVPVSYRLPVYYCVEPAVQITGEQVRRVVDEMNRVVSSFFARESAGRVSVSFTFGGVVTPAGADWSRQHVAGADGLRRWEARERFSCYRAGWEHSGTDLFVMFLPPNPADSKIGGAYPDGPIFIDRIAHGGWHHPGGIQSTVAHEVGHALFKWDHTDNQGCRYEQSVMDSDGECHLLKHHDYELSLGDFDIPCPLRQQAGWPC